MTWIRTPRCYAGGFASCIEACLAGIVLAGGVRTSFLGSPWLDIPLTLLWIVGITNAFNLLDNMNGLSAGVAAIGGDDLCLAGRAIRPAWAPSNSPRP